MYIIMYNQMLLSYCSVLSRQPQFPAARRFYIIRIIICHIIIFLLLVYHIIIIIIKYIGSITNTRKL